MAEQSNINSPRVLSSRVRYREVGGDGVLVHLDQGRVVVVNGIGLHVVSLLATPQTCSEIAAAIAQEFDVEQPAALADVETYLQALDAEQMLDSPAGAV